jgi:hypothetical protein
VRNSLQRARLYSPFFSVPLCSLPAIVLAIVRDSTIVFLFTLKEF